MLTIGLTGGIGSGKSVVAELFAKLGVPIIDTDQIAHDLTQPHSTATKKIIEHFGESILNNEGQLNRQALADNVFKNPAEKKWLEALLHPLILAEVDSAKSQLTEPYCIVVIPLLIETMPHPEIERILAVDAPEELQITRTLNRDPQRPRAEIENIIKSQVSREERLNYADDVIDNDGTLAEVGDRVKVLHQQYLSLALSRNTK